MSAKYTIGVDFGTESGRAVLVDVANGREIVTAVHPYANRVIDEVLPDSDIRLEPDWALQDPNDYLEVFKKAIPAVLDEGKVNPGTWWAWVLTLPLARCCPPRPTAPPCVSCPSGERIRMPGSNCGSTMRPNLRQTS